MIPKEKCSICGEPVGCDHVPDVVKLWCPKLKAMTDYIIKPGQQPRCTCILCTPTWDIFLDLHGRPLNRQDVEEHGRMVMEHVYCPHIPYIPPKDEE